VRYESGIITNLELLEGSTIVSESHLMLLKSKIDYTLSLYKLKTEIGERLYYKVMGKKRKMTGEISKGTDNDGC